MAQITGLGKAFRIRTGQPTNAFNGLLKTINDKTGGIIGNLIHDDALGSNCKQAFLKLSTDPTVARNFFDHFANDLGVTVNTFTASNGIQGAYFDLPGSFIIKFVPTSSGQNTTTGIAFPTLEILKNGIPLYKLRFIN